MPNKEGKQGKMIIEKIIQGKLKGMKKKEISEMAGSIAVSDSAKINAVNRAEKSDEYRLKSKVFIDKLNKEIIRLIEAIQIKDLDKVEYEKAVNSLEKLNKMKELLSGNSTERVEISSETVKSYLNNA